MISEKLGDVYSGLEEKYYGLLDFLDKKGLPVYTYNDFLEEKGLPAFPITIALIVLFIAVIYGLLFIGSAVNPAITLNFEDQFNDGVSAVQVTFEDTAGNIVRPEEKVSDGATITLNGIPLGTKLVIVAEKSGFKRAEHIIDVKKQTLSATIFIEREIVVVSGEIQLVDQETGDPIRGALVTAVWRDVTKNETSDSEGKVSFAGIPENMEVLVTIQADGYETSTGNYPFRADELKTIPLVGSSISLAGKSNLIVSIVDAAGNPVKGATIYVLDRESDTSLDERTVEDSEALFSIPKGTSARLIVQKDGFLRYDSLETGESRTMRLEDEQWPVVLEQGGTRLIATVFVGQTPLSDATVQLFDINGNFLEYDITGFGGTVEFANLEPKEYYITGWKQGYLPSRDKVNIASTETVSIMLESADSTNSSYVGISVLDSFKSMANNANLVFRENVNGEILPLGIPSIQTDLTGYASIVAKTGTVVVVEAEKDMQTGSNEKLVEANKDNQMIVELSRPIEVIELQIVDEDGNPVEGNVIVETVTGQPLFDGPIEEGRAFFDGEGNKDVVVKVETLEGETFSQVVSVEGLETVQVTLGEEASGISPTVAFTGIFNELGEKVEGLASGEDYWLGFSISWPSGVEKGGFHLRLGSDAVTFVDSEEVGVIGFEATTANYFYGRSYQPQPSPGNETGDKQNVGTPGVLNKVLELYFDQPENTVALRARVKTRDLISAEQVEVHYRAWTEAGGKFFRSPLDAALGEEPFTESKTGLYAETNNVTVSVFRTEATCQEEICGNYFFVMPSGIYVETQLFKAVTEETYALEIDLSSKQPVGVTLNFETDKADPKIKFTGYDIDEFVDQPESEDALPETDLSGQGYLDWAVGSEEAQSGTNPLGFKTGGDSTSLTISSLNVSPDERRKVRVYFTGTDEGVAEIRMQAVGQSVLNETFTFQVDRDRPLLVSVDPREVGVGEAFTVKVLNGEDGAAVQDAVVQLLDSKGKIAASIAGRGSTRKGLRGEYYFSNSLDPGIYTVSISAPGFKSEEFELTIARNDLLTVQSPITIDVSKETREKSASIGIHNTANEDITGLSYEIEKDSGFPGEITVSMSMPSSVVAGQDATATARVTVNLNEDSEDNLYGEARLILKGMAAGGYPTSTESTLKISYNKQLDEDCLYFDKQRLQVRLIGTGATSSGYYGNDYSSGYDDYSSGYYGGSGYGSGSEAIDEFEVENKCGVALNLEAKVKSLLTDDPNIEVSVSQLRIEKDGVETVKVTVRNRIERRYDIQNRRDYTITFESSQIAKSIPLSVEIVNPAHSLSYPPSVALWMIRSASQELAYAQSPIQIMNNGPMPITAFRAAVTPEAYMQGITTGIRPTSVGGITLYPGAGLSPQRYVYAESSKTEALERPGQGWIQLGGVIGGRMQHDLGKIPLTVNYSGTKCLTVTGVDSMIFSSKDASQGTLERTIKIKNECGDRVRLTGQLKPQKVSGNTFVLTPAELMPGQEQSFKLILLKGQEANRTATLKVVGLLVSQNQFIESNELRVTLKLGEKAGTADGKATSPMSLKVCGEDETHEVKFPILSSDCANGYCDAKQLAEYLVEKAGILAKMAEDKIKRADKDASKFGNCKTKEFCTFEDMGVLSEDEPVYLQLDFLSREVLEMVLKETKGELKNYSVGHSIESFEALAGNFSTGTAYLSDNFKGCGKYYVKITGAARVYSEQEILFDDSEKNFAIAINITQDRVVTDECLHNVENVSNMLPVDEGFKILQHFQAWPGFVKAGSEFEELGKALAQELFGTSDGRYSASISSSSNKVEIVKGDTDGGLLKIRIGKEGKSDQPETVYAHVPASYTNENKEMTNAIAKAFSTFKANSFSEEDCWGKDDTGQYIVMHDYKELEKLYGKLEIKGEQAIRIGSQTQCIDLNVTSKAQENVWFSTDFLQEGKNPSRDGIEFLEIKDKRGNVLLREQSNEQRIPADPSTGKKLELKKSEKPDAAGAEYYKGEFELCITGNTRFSNAVQKIGSISITGHGSATKNRITDPPFKVDLQACGLHPKEFVEKVIEREKSMENNTEETYYVVLGWKGPPEPPEELDIRKLRRMLALQAEIEKQGPSAFGEPITGLDSYNSKMMKYRYGSIATYLAACAPVAFFAPWGSVLADCVLPAGWAALDIAQTTKDAKDFIIETVKDVLGPIAKVTIAPIINGISRLFGGEGEWDPTAAEAPGPYVGEEAADTQFESLLEGAATFSLTKASLEGLSAAGTKVTLSSARTIMSSSLWDDFAKDFVTKKMPNLSADASSALQKELAEKAKDEAAKALFEPTHGPGISPRNWHYTKLKAGVRGNPLDEVAKGALDNSFAASQTKFDEILGGVLNQQNLSNELKILKNNSVDQIFDTRTVADDLMTRFQGEGLETLASSTDKVMRERIANQVLYSLERNNKEVVEKLAEELGTSTVSGREVLRQRILQSVDDEWIRTTGKPNVKTTFRQLMQQVQGGPLPRNTDVGKLLDTLSSADKARYSAALKGNIDDIVDRTLTNFTAGNTDDIYKAMQKTVNGTMLTKFKTQYADDLADLAKDAAKKPGALTRIGRFFKGLGGGILSGLAANGLGMLAHYLYWKGVGPNPVESEASFMTSELFQTFDSEGNLIEENTILKDIKIIKHLQYKVIISKNMEGKTNLEMIEVKTESQFDEMDEDIKKDPSINWSTDCKSYAKEKVDLLIGKLDPVADPPGGLVTQDHALAYQKNAEIIRYSSAQYGIDEELIMAVLLEQPEKIKECGIPEEWWAKDLDDDQRNDIIGCASKRLRDAAKERMELSSFTEATDKSAYIAKVTELQKAWARFRTVEAS